MDQSQKPPDGVLIEAFFKNEAKSLEIKEKEIPLREAEVKLKLQQDQNLLDYSKTALDANLKDRESERKSKEKNFRWLIGSLVLIVVLIVIFMSFSVYMGKEQVVIELIKYIGLFFAGGAGGYGLKSTRIKKDESSN